MFLYSHWLSLPLPTRNKIAQEFNITKKGSTEVVANVVKSDGYMIQDVEGALTVERLQEYLGTDEVDIMVLWRWLVERVEGRYTDAPEVYGSIAVAVEVSAEEFKELVGSKGDAAVEHPKPKRGRPKKVK